MKISEAISEMEKIRGPMEHQPKDDNQVCPIFVPDYKSILAHADMAKVSESIQSRIQKSRNGDHRSP